jgi:hypothetical protein
MPPLYTSGAVYSRRASDWPPLVKVSMLCPDRSLALTECSRVAQRLFQCLDSFLGVSRRTGVCDQVMAGAWAALRASGVLLDAWEGQGGKQLDTEAAGASPA